MKGLAGARLKAEGLTVKVKMPEEFKEVEPWIPSFTMQKITARVEKSVGFGGSRRRRRNLSKVDHARLLAHHHPVGDPIRRSLSRSLGDECSPLADDN